MTTNVTSTATWHASQATTSDAPLLADVFFGRHFSDTGLRISKPLNISTRNSMELGAEAWTGNSWPDGTKQSTYDAYLKFKHTSNTFSMDSGFWAMQTNPKARTDTRYNGAHSHSQPAANSSSDYFFTGDIFLAGAYGKVTWNLSELNLPNTQLLFQLEWITQTMDGSINNGTQTVLLTADNTGTAISLGATHRKNTFILQYEQLVLENRFTGDVTTIFVRDAGLMNKGFEPSRMQLYWAYKAAPSLQLHSTIVADETYAEETDYRINIGFSWAHSWPF